MSDRDILSEYGGDSGIQHRHLALLSTATWAAREALSQLGWTRRLKWTADGRSITFNSVGKIADPAQPS